MDKLKETLQHPNLHIGMRNVKTALTATLCALLYLPFDRNPTFACIGAVFGMGYNMDNSKLHGGNRLFGTAFGGFIAMALFRFYIIFYPDGRTTPFMLLLFFIGIVVLILVSQNQHSELIPHRKDGTIQNPDSHGNDPCPPKDKNQ